MTRTFAEGHFAANISDLVDVVDYTCDRWRKPLMLLGHSLGGAAALAAAARREGCHRSGYHWCPCRPWTCEEAASSRARWRRANGHGTVTIAGRSFEIDREFVDALEGTSMRDAVSSLRRPLIVFHAPGDTVVGVENAALLFGYARHPKSFISLDTADHLLSGRKDAQYVGRVLAAWIERYV